MELDWETCDRARLRRDPSFDGLFFTGVRTTRIYCRPVCPVHPAKSANVVFFATAAAAERAGFRPCLRCRPEAAPGSPAWRGTATTVARGMRLIEEGFLDRSSVTELAEKLGVGPRHLRRLSSSPRRLAERNGGNPTRTNGKALARSDGIASRRYRLVRRISKPPAFQRGFPRYLWPRALLLSTQRLRSPAGAHATTRGGGAANGRGGRIACRSGSRTARQGLPPRSRTAACRRRARQR
jgi:hypothetical protein